ncbi:translation initiation factor IF-2-like [Zalophus californianus]|uniref:Translation initiation factor IF-2-like n=1 Tax=Zalophus californianus TaxID=9704 RepID=A0A6J2FI53_ZALCA|nr:translation initiation factor IF-2-like [Zalophus californianus]
MLIRAVSDTPSSRQLCADQSLKPRRPRGSRPQPLVRGAPGRAGAALAVPHGTTSSRDSVRAAPARVSPRCQPASNHRGTWRRSVAPARRSAGGTPSTGCGEGFCRGRARPAAPARNRSAAPAGTLRPAARRSRWPLASPQSGAGAGERGTGATLAGTALSLLRRALPDTGAPAPLGSSRLGGGGRRAAPLRSPAAAARTSPAARRSCRRRRRRSRRPAGPRAESRPTAGGGRHRRAFAVPVRPARTTRHPEAAPAAPLRPASQLRRAVGAPGQPTSTLARPGSTSDPDGPEGQGVHAPAPLRAFEERDSARLEPQPSRQARLFKKTVLGNLLASGGRSAHQLESPQGSRGGLIAQPRTMCPKSRELFPQGGKMNVNCVPAETEATRAYTRENFTLQLEEIKANVREGYPMSNYQRRWRCYVGTTQNLHHILGRWV